MSQPLPFSGVPYCHKPGLPEKTFFPARLFVGNSERPFHEVIRREGGNRPPRSLRASETPNVVVRLRAIPTVKRRLTQRTIPSSERFCTREVVTWQLCTIQETWRSGSRCRIRAIPELAGRL